MALNADTLSQIHALQEICARDGDVLLVALTPLQASVLIDAVELAVRAGGIDVEHQGVMSDAADVIHQVLRDYEEMA